LIVTPDFPTAPEKVTGGVQGACYYLSQALSAIPGMQVEVVVGGRALVDGRQRPPYVLGRVQVRTLSTPSRWPFSIYLLFVLPRLLRRHLQRVSADMLHFQNVALWAVGVDRPSVLTVHGIGERDALFRGHRLAGRLRSAGIALTEGRARRKIRHIVAINPYVAQFLNGSRTQRIWDVENPVADSFFDVVRAPHPRRILCAGSITERKNVAGLIQAFALVAAAQADVELRIAGAGMDQPYGRLCQQLVHELHLERHVSFLGPLSIGQIQTELSQTGCLALTSLQETAPLSISEAMAAGVPVLASNLCGNPWMVEEGVTGRLVNPEDRGDIARGLTRLLFSDDQTKMGARAKFRAEKRFRGSAVALSTAAVYQAILENALPAGCAEATRRARGCANGFVLESVTPDAPGMPAPHRAARPCDAA
jgi:glycosyltransferase involved in cell wall biosynthesis